jgi:FlaA1/EpsC-like NDP-sugar epimerase
MGWVMDLTAILCFILIVNFLILYNYMKPNESARRDFLKKALALSAVTAMPGFITNTVSATGTKLASPGERVNLACCGCGNRGAEIIEALYKTGLCNIVALCDVDMGAPHTLKILQKFPDVPRFQDYRKMFD